MWELKNGSIVHVRTLAVARASDLMHVCTRSAVAEIEMLFLLPIFSLITSPTNLTTKPNGVALN